MSTTAASIGFIGAGNMGRPMIAHLQQAGHDLTVFARRPEVFAALQAQGVRVAATPAQAAAQAEFIFVNVTSTADVEAVLFGTDGVAQRARPGSIVIDHSTISPVATREFAARLAARGIEMLDAPVSGGVAGAQAATLAIMVGGKAAVLDRARPLLAVLGKSIVHVGEHGAGQVTKLCNQIVQVVNIEGIAEAMLFARSQGVALAGVLSALQAGFAGSKMLDLMGPKMATRDFAAGIEARLHDKDFGLAADLADALKLPMPAVQVVRAQLRALVAAGMGYDDTSSLLRVLEQAAAPANAQHGGTGDQRPE